MELKKLIEKVRNTHGYENLKEYLGKDLGSLLYQIVDKADEQQVKNLNIPAVAQQSEQLSCSTCTFLERENDVFCDSCYKWSKHEKAI